MLRRGPIETLSLEERIQMQNRKTKTSKTSNSPETSQKRRANKNRPREMSSKIPSAAREPRPPVRASQRRAVDPRFDGLYGEYVEKEFKSNYGFVENLNKKEIDKLAKLSKKEKNPEQRDKIKTALKRASDRERELEKVRTLRQKVSAEKSKIAENLAQGRPSRFKTKSETKLSELVNKFGALKEKGKLLKYIKKKNKSKPSLGFSME